MAVVQILILPAGARLRWLLATLLGGGIGFVLLSVIGEILAAIIDYRVRVALSEGIIQMTSGGVLGLAIAIAQRLVLRNILPRCYILSKHHNRHSCLSVGGRKLRRRAF